MVASRHGQLDLENYKRGGVWPDRYVTQLCKVQGQDIAIKVTAVPDPTQRQNRPFYWSLYVRFLDSKPATLVVFIGPKLVTLFTGF